MNTNVANKRIKKVIDGGIVSPQGFYAAGTHAGLRHAKLDMAMIYSETGANSAAVYTLNQFQAAPLAVTKESIQKEGKLQAVIINSANANACTGKQGMKDAIEMRKLAAEKLKINEYFVGVASTGVIGEFLPMDKIREGIKKLAVGQTKDDVEAFQTAILTTDTVMKASCYETIIDGKKVTMGGAAKGSGMINPNMATMLGFLTTDAAVATEDLQAALKEVTNGTFNQITVDGDTSTNDMVIVLANGQAGNELLTKEHPEWDLFKELLRVSCESLAKQIAKDGEGATKLIDVEVIGARTEEEARFVAKQIVGSNLVKTAIHGEDPNWGRIIGAIGQSTATINVQTVDIKLGDVSILENSEPQSFSQEDAVKQLKNDIVHIYVNLNNGNGKGQAWGCDLSYDYIKINASYRT